MDHAKSIWKIIDCFGWVGAIHSVLFSLEGVKSVIIFLLTVAWLVYRLIEQRAKTKKQVIELRQYENEVNKLNLENNTEHENKRLRNRENK